jgi:Uma2 family endonuclease
MEQESESLQSLQYYYLQIYLKIQNTPLYIFVNAKRENNYSVFRTLYCEIVLLEGNQHRYIHIINALK